jgi:hypothetical protein
MADPFKGTAFEASPIVVDGRLIFPTRSTA